MERQKVLTMLKSVADTTNRTYDSAWKHWYTFAALRDKEPFLVGGNQSRADEDELLAFISQ